MKLGETVISVVLLVLFLAAWQWLPGLLHVPTFFIPPFLKVFAEFLRMLAQEHLAYHTAMTTQAVVLGFVIGNLLGMSPTAEVVLSPYILGLQIAPKVAFAPLFILWFGYTEYPKIVVAVLIVFFPVLIN